MTARKADSGAADSGAADSGAADSPAVASGASQATLELLFADDGAFHTQEVVLPVEILDRYPRLIDCLQEDPEVLRTLYVDLQRLCSVRRTS